MSHRILPTIAKLPVFARSGILKNFSEPRMAMCTVLRLFFVGR
jgi:hypothetical protein